MLATIGPTCHFLSVLVGEVCLGLLTRLAFLVVSLLLLPVVLVPVALLSVASPGASLVFEITHYRLG
jgi:hypothetical protein